MLPTRKLTLPILPATASSPGFHDEERSDFINLLAKGFTGHLSAIFMVTCPSATLAGQRKQDFKNQQHRLENRLLVDSQTVLQTRSLNQI